MDYQIVHAIEGRLRLRISPLGTDAVFAGKLNQLVDATVGVSSVRVNSQAQSIVITYKPNKISQPALLQAIEAAMAQIAPPPAASEDSNEKPATTPTATPASIKPPESSSPSAEAQPEDQTPIATVSNPVEAPVFDPTTIDLQEDPWTEAPSIPAVSHEMREASPAAANQAEANQIASDEADSWPTTVSEPDATVETAIADQKSAVKSAAIPAASLESISAFLETIPALSEPLSSQALAQRLGVTVQQLNRYRSRPDFAQWCRSKDSDGTVWTFDSSTKRFHPVIAEEPFLKEASSKKDAAINSGKINSDEINAAIVDLSKETVDLMTADSDTISSSAVDPGENDLREDNL